MAAVVAGVLAVATGCRQVDEIRDDFRDRTAHEAYAASLDEAGLAGTALGQDWIERGRDALVNPVEVRLPYQEEGFLPSTEAGALGFRMDLERGQRLTLDLEVRGESPARVFIDLYRADPDGAREPLYVVSADSAAHALSYTVRRDGAYVVRIQPELLRGGEYRVTLRSNASLAFPVSGAGTGNIQSYFGADRDGGRRSHHGVDIFSPRGTPVVAGAAGYVSRVQVTGLGGKVVWLRDREQNQSLYYAHLDSQLVRQGTYVRVGEVLGLVGNTGNARTTPPHLHFGIYRRGEGPVDPLPFLRDRSGEVPALTADRARLGTWVRVSVPDARLRGDPSNRAAVVETLALHTLARADAASGAYYRVTLPDGRRGFLAASASEGVDTPVGEELAAAPLPLRSAPSETAPVVERTGAGLALPVLGAFGGYLYVRGEGGRAAWLRAEALGVDGP